MIQVTLTLLARGQMNGELATEHANTVGVFECVLCATRVRVLYVGVVVFLESALDYLTVASEQVLDLTLCARERKVGHVEFGWNDSCAAAAAAARTRGRIACRRRRSISRSISRINRIYTRSSR